MNARNKLIIHKSSVQQGLLTFQEAHHLVGVRKPFHAFLINPWQLWEGVLIFLPFKTICRWPYSGTKCGINVTPTITSWLTISWDALRHLPLRPLSRLPISHKCRFLPISHTLHWPGLCVAQLDPRPGPCWWHCVPPSLLSCWQAALIAFQTQPHSPAWHSKHPSFQPSPQPHFPDSPSGAFLSSLTPSGQTCFFFQAVVYYEIQHKSPT